ncbi:hypothetical protein J7W08_10935 [Methanococcoides orientis]|uniref:DUF7544 domain-containing protein n=1 Tax=Methanococcoides orientis TaxID=2822137 RepID=UPI001E61003A|nr:hypothetical protein [Methanococcoides orientis]UGV40559.1 hypothetical protein J7W08_10935 [Methanococcoides orientis]
MDWFVVNAVGKALRRTRQCLLEPFDLKKWLKLAIIVALAGGGGSSGYNGSTPNTGNSDLPDLPFSYIPNGNVFVDQITSTPDLPLILAIVGSIGLFILILWYISSVMDFVFVESITKNDVRLWESSKRYMRMGLNLFIIRFVLAIGFFAIFIMAALPLIIQMINDPATSFMPMLIAGGMSLVAIILIIWIFSTIIYSFIYLCIPISMYDEIGIIEALEKVVATFRQDWKQMIAYWFGRFILWTGGGVAFGIIILLLMLMPGLLFLLIDGIIYFALSEIVQQSIIWLILAPFAAIEIALLILFSIMGIMPLHVFMKYHMLVFLEKWSKDTTIPFFELADEN